MDILVSRMRAASLAHVTLMVPFPLCVTRTQVHVSVDPKSKDHTVTHAPVATTTSRLVALTVVAILMEQLVVTFRVMRTPDSALVKRTSLGPLVIHVPVDSRL